MIRILFFSLTWLSAVANAQLSDEILVILSLPGSDQASALDKREAELYNMYSADSEIFNGILCSRGTEFRPNRFLQAIDEIKQRVADPDIFKFSVGEIIYFANCNGRSLLEENISPEHLEYNENGVSDTTKTIIRELSLLLRFPGRLGKTPLEFVDEQIRIHYDLNSTAGDNVASVYSQIKRLIQSELR